jgi:hypothetical protein
MLFTGLYLTTLEVRAITASTKPYTGCGWSKNGRDRQRRNNKNTLKEEKEMRTKSVLILASIAAILIVAGTGNAFADYSWSGYDGSKVQSTTSVNGYCVAYGDPFVMTPAVCTWSNNLYDDYSAASYFNAAISSVDAANVAKNNYGYSKLTYHSAAYTPTGTTSGTEGSLGDSEAYCTHTYSYNGGSTKPSYTFEQDYYLY